MSSDCQGSERCFNGFCVPGERPDADLRPLDAATDAAAVDSAVDAGSTPCVSDDDCSVGERCVESLCVSSDVDAGGTDGGADADSGPGCVDISGVYTICDGMSCPSPVCHASTVMVLATDEPCVFDVISDNPRTMVNGRFVVGRDEVTPDSETEFRRRGTLEFCDRGMLVFDQPPLADQIEFSCEGCPLILQK